MATVWRPTVSNSSDSPIARDNNPVACMSTSLPTISIGAWVLSRITRLSVSDMPPKLHTLRQLASDGRPSGMLTAYRRATAVEATIAARLP